MPDMTKHQIDTLKSAIKGPAKAPAVTAGKLRNLGLVRIVDGAYEGRGFSRIELTDAGRAAAAA